MASDDETIDLGFIPILLQPEVVNGEIVVNDLDCQRIAEEVTRRLMGRLSTERRNG